MKRITLALAIAGASCAVSASPPPGGGPPMPVDVTVKNVPLPVAETPSYTTPDRLLFVGTGGGITGGGSTTIISLTPTDEDTVLLAYDVQAHVEQAATSTCTVESDIFENDGTQSGKFITGLGRIVALPGRDATLSLRLPSVYVDAAKKYYLKVQVTAPSGGLCHFDTQMRGVKLP